MVPSVLGGLAEIRHGILDDYNHELTFRFPHYLRNMTNAITRAYRHLELQNQMWLNQRVAWIVQEFGRDHINQVECLLPTSGRMVEYRGGTDEAVIEYFNKITCDLGLDPEAIAFSIEDHLETDDGAPALGLYSEPEEGQFSIAMAADQLSDPCELAATLVHELCHVHLLGHRRIQSQAHDQEPLTDLLCVFMGYGIIAANSVIHHRSDGLGAYSQSLAARQGYMSMSMFGYALALFAGLRNEDGKQWRRHMRPDVRDAFDHSLRFFHRNGLPDLSVVPADFIEPILRLETTLQPPPTAALASLYAYSDDQEISEDAVDYPVVPPELAHELGDKGTTVDRTSEADQEDARCIYCGATGNLKRVVLPAVDDSIVCTECLESIEEGAREAAQPSPVDDQVSRLIGIILFISIALVAVLILWSVVTGIWNG